MALPVVAVLDSGGFACFGEYRYDRGFVSGLARGPARVIHGNEDLFGFQSGEILVCDSVSPDMTFLTPLAAAIVERRGGMLIHGSIIGIALVPVWWSGFLFLILIEEESLERAIGAKYVDYKKKVRGRIIPGMPI